jgi:hypothetical protein
MRQTRQEGISSDTKGKFVLRLTNNHKEIDLLTLTKDELLMTFESFLQTNDLTNNAHTLLKLINMQMG